MSNFTHIGVVICVKKLSYSMRIDSKHLKSLSNLVIAKNLKILLGLECKFDLDQSEREPSQVNASAPKAWTNSCKLTQVFNLRLFVSPFGQDLRINRFIIHSLNAFLLAFTVLFPSNVFCPWV